MSNKRLSIDVGGTFVDFVLFDPATEQITIEKVASSGQLAQRFFEGPDRLGVDLTDIDSIVHGSTMVINTIVQETGASVGLITTQGFRDVLELGRGNRPDVYDLFYKQPAPLVPRSLRFEVPERLNAAGEILEPLDEAAAIDTISALKKANVQSVAICFLHAYTNDVHEARMAQLVAEHFPTATISTSSQIVREWLEYERTSTTVLNAYTQPPMTTYLSALEDELTKRDYSGSLTFMQSSGGTTSSSVVKAAPIRTIQSGPAGGVIGAAALGQTLGLNNLVSADVGGTTFDVALIENGRALEESRTQLNRRPVLQPTIDIVSVGAGGGSIAWIDKEGSLQIGPQSAQADPGPVCFGLGGSEPTVTDAQVVLGYLDPHYYLGKRMTLDADAALAAIDTKIAQPLGLSPAQAARGIIHLTNMNMVLAIRQVTIERGQDPRDAALVCFGGGGGLFAAALMAELEMPQAVIPVNPATFSAWGLLNADFREDLVHTQIQPLADLAPADLAAQFAQLEADARKTLLANNIPNDHIRIQRIAECRYIGQSHTVRVPVLDTDFSGEDLPELKARFDQSHQRAYAHALPEHAAEIVGLRLTAQGTTIKPAIPTIPPMADPITDPIDSAIKTHRPVDFAGSTTGPLAGPVDTPIYDRTKLGAGATFTGPAVIEEPTSTILVNHGQRVEVDAWGNLILSG